MAWSAITVGAGILIVGVHVAWCLRHAALPRAVSAHILLAFLNIVGAATLGVLIGFDKVYHFLPGFVLSNVFAHAHLAAIGWATMMVVGVAYRLLPMILPAAMPEADRRLWISAVLLEAGVCGLFVTLLVRVRWCGFALTVTAGFAAFVSHVVWMLRRPRPRPPGVRRPDPAVLHAGASFVWLVVASALGIWLTVAEPSPNTLRAAMAYGVCRARRVPRPDGRGNGRAVAADLRVVLGVRQHGLQGAGGVAARHALARRAGLRVRVVVVRRSRTGRRSRLRRPPVRSRRRMVLVGSHGPRRCERRLYPALRLCETSRVMLTVFQDADRGHALQRALIFADA